MNILFGLAVVLVLLYTVFCALVFTAIGSNHGSRTSDREVLRRVLRTDTLDDCGKVAVLELINDDIYEEPDDE